MSKPGLERTLEVLALFESAGVVVHYENGKLRLMPKDALNPGLRDLLKRHRRELCALLAGNDIIRLETAARAVRRRFGRSHGVKELDAYEFVAGYVFRFAGVAVRQYHAMTSGARPPN